MHGSRMREAGEQRPAFDAQGCRVPHRAQTTRSAPWPPLGSARLGASASGRMACETGPKRENRAEILNGFFQIGSCSRWRGLETTNSILVILHSVKSYSTKKSICQVTFKLANSGDNPTAEPGLQPTAFRLGASATLTILELLPDLTVPQSRPAPYPPRTDSRPFSLA
jgi:hypothetical protein